MKPRISYGDRQRLIARLTALVERDQELEQSFTRFTGQVAHPVIIRKD